MREIQMVDLKGQHSHIKSRLDNKILGVVNEAQYIRGQEVVLLEDELSKYLDVPYTITCGNGTDALQISMMALGLQRGDEVITTNFTYVATAEIIALLGLTPVLIDVEPDTFNMDPAELEKAITPKTKAVVVVHLFGQSANMEPIIDIAQRHKINVVEDNAQAFGGAYLFSNRQIKKTGTMGTIGCTSFFPSKNLGCMGDGGAIFTKDESLAKKIRMIANHGQSSLYYHDLIGVNSRLDTIQAAVLRVKLEYIDQYNRQRYDAAKLYRERLQDLDVLEIPKEATYAQHVYHQYTLKIKDVKRRDGLKAFLNHEKIPAKVYYPLPLSSQKPYKHSRVHKKHITEYLCASVLSLPMHTELEIEQIDYITNRIKKYFKS